MSRTTALDKDKLRPMNLYPVAGYPTSGLIPAGGITMTTLFSKLFTSHPAKVGETYFSHMAFAAWFCSRLLMAAGAALVHAFLPFLFETAASRIVRELYERTHNRGSHAVKEPQALLDRA
ncbi:Type 1 capsular polysaccharide biosynthesis protein J [Mesorhizobium sp. L2C089B000]|nr:Type 1 capsular polysaccharide biosynthesis protein J [Mesorhizobium sp. L2C089B000]